MCNFLVNLVGKQSKDKSPVRSPQSKKVYNEFQVAIEKYLEKNHAELVLTCDLEKPASEVYYLPMHPVFKETSTTT